MKFPPLKAQGLALYTEAAQPHWCSPRDPTPTYVAQVQWLEAPAYESSLGELNPEAIELNPPATYADAEAWARLLAAAPKLYDLLSSRTPLPCEDRDIPRHDCGCRVCTFNRSADKILRQIDPQES